MKIFKQIVVLTVFYICLFSCDNNNNINLVKETQNTSDVDTFLLRNCIIDTLFGEWVWEQTYTAKLGFINNEFKSVINIFSQNGDESVNYNVYVDDTLFVDGTLRFELTQNAIIKLPHWNNSDKWRLSFFGIDGQPSNNTLCFFSGNADDNWYYYKKIK